MKKIMSILVLVCIVASLCTVSAFAAGGITVNGAGNYASLSDAINAAASGATIQLPAGTFEASSLPNGGGKSLTIVGAGRTDTTLIMKNAQYEHGASGYGTLTFKSVTIEEDNNIYNGITNSSGFSYDDCNIKGQYFAWSTAPYSFNNCTFTQTSPDAYNIWTYSATSIKFTNCAFTSAGKSVLVYNEGHNSTNLTADVCTFEASQTVAGKAAIEIDSSLLSGSQAFSINISNAQASGFDTNSNCSNQLWNEKKSADKATVTVGGTTVYEQGGAATPVNPNTGAPTGSNPPVNPNPNPGTNPNLAPAAPAVENIYYVPATDDNSNMALWSILALALITTAFATRKKKTEN